MALLVATSKVDIEYSREGVRHTATVTFEDPKQPGYPILPAVREWHPPYEMPDFEVIGGLVLMELTINHIELFHETAPSQSVIESLTPMVVSVEPRVKPSVVIANVLVGSMAARLGVFGPGTLLDEVCGKKTHTLDDVRNALRHPLPGMGAEDKDKDKEKEKEEDKAEDKAEEGGKAESSAKEGREHVDDGLFLTFKSKNNDFVVLDMHKALVEEFELSSAYLYPVSHIIGDAFAGLSPAALEYVCAQDAEMLAAARALAKQSKKRLAASQKK
jgi:hypothetical protein